MMPSKPEDMNFSKLGLHEDKSDINRKEQRVVKPEQPTCNLKKQTIDGADIKTLSNNDPNIQSPEISHSSTTENIPLPEDQFDNMTKTADYKLDQREIDRMSMLARQALINDLINKATADFQKTTQENMEKSNTVMLTRIEKDQKEREEHRQKHAEVLEKMNRKLKVEMQIEAEKRKRENQERLARHEQWKRNIDQRDLEHKMKTSEAINKRKQELEEMASALKDEALDRREKLETTRKAYRDESDHLREELRKRDEQIRRDLEEARQFYKEILRNSQEQMEEIMKQIDKAQWGRVIEANWKNQLNALKSTDKRIFRAIGTLRMQLATARSRDVNPELLRKDAERMKAELNELKRVMDREVGNLEKMYEYSGKLFVLDISDALNAISTVCQKFIDYLDALSFEDSRPDEIYNRVDGFQFDFSSVYRAIPNIESLKAKYSDDTPRQNEAIMDDGHVVLIEEVDD